MTTDNMYKQGWVNGEGVQIFTFLKYLLSNGFKFYWLCQLKSSTLTTSIKRSSVRIFKLKFPYKICKNWAFYTDFQWLTLQIP